MQLGKFLERKKFFFQGNIYFIPNHFNLDFAAIVQHSYECHMHVPDLKCTKNLFNTLYLIRYTTLYKILEIHFCIQFLWTLFLVALFACFPTLFVLTRSTCNKHQTDSS